MDANRLQTLQEPLQIISVIEKGAPFGGDLWQTGTLGRQIYPIIQIHADIDYDKIILQSFNLNELDQSSPIFIRLYYRNLIFRLDPAHYKIVGEKIICQYPPIARALEPRKHERYVLPYNTNTSLSIRRSMRSLRDLGRDLEVRILDVSEYGFGIMISGMNRDYLQINDKLWIKSIDQRPLSSYIFGNVTYVAPKGIHLKRNDVRVGLKLERPLNYEVFDRLKRKSHLILGN